MHGDAARFQAPALRKLKKGDTLLVCGDFGFLWDGSKAEQALLKKIGKRKFHVAFIDGVHENFELLGQYPEEEWNGGRVHRISGNLVHLMRGQMFTIEGKRIFAMGGGVSPDDDFRPADDNRMRWEVPSREELDRAAAAIERAGGRMDYIVTHEPPMRIKAFLQLKQQSAALGEVTGLNTFFEEVSKCCKFKRWFFGSMHTDKHIATTHVAVFRKVLKLED
jgi:hypothetical protein